MCRKYRASVSVFVRVCVCERECVPVCVYVSHVKLSMNLTMELGLVIYLTVVCV